MSDDAAALSHEARVAQCKSPKAPESGKVQGMNKIGSVSGSEASQKQLRKES